ncbi:MAG: LacI family DNA-binding transcriptional regulator [Clostridia bacterium]|nr:LacI family DNA-binding transcriptional regulator [Clostridia bacterium]
MASENATIYDIASDAGVSIATVSRVLRGESNVSDETRQKVQRAIERRNYRPSSIARGLMSKKTHSLGIILPKLLNPHYAMIFTGAQEEARMLGYTVSLFPWSSLDTKAYDPATMLIERRLDGLIVCVEYLPDDHGEHVLASLRELRRVMPVVLIGCVPPWYDFPAVSNNNAAMMKEIVLYLVSLGHERIAFIGGFAEDNDPQRRDIGYREGLREARLPYIESYRVFCKGTPEDGRAALRGMLDALKPEYWPSAVIAMNDLVAMGCQGEARDRGLRMPEDLSIIGWDDLFCAPYLCPPLTSINTHQQQTGARAVQLLLGGEQRRETVDWELVERASCAPINKGKEI